MTVTLPSQEARERYQALLKALDLGHEPLTPCEPSEPYDFYLAALPDGI